ncbi:hypothetical protein [Vibrio parahaemolyticus]
MSIEPICLLAQRHGDVIEIIEKETGSVQACYPEQWFTEELALAEYEAVHLKFEQ